MANIEDEIINDFYNNTDDSSVLTIEEENLLSEVLEEVHQEIPKNSDSLLVDETTSRFSSAIWYDKIKEKQVILAGVGGIGSYVGFLLGRLKINKLWLFDPDTVESVNMSGQLYSIADIGKYKIEALSSMLRNYADYAQCNCIASRYTEVDDTSDIMICGFDNMEARKVFFNNWVRHVYSKPEEERKNCLFIDGRLAAEEFQILCIKGDDSFNIKRYTKDFLFLDKEADETICSYKQTSFCASMIASYMVNLFVNFCANQCNVLIDRDLPFFTTYNAELMYFKTEQ